MNLSTLYHKHRDRFDEAMEDVDWSEVAYALDEGDYFLLQILLLRKLKPMADAVQAELPRDNVDEIVDRRLQREIDEEAA